jgi:uncharacterized protein
MREPARILKANRYSMQLSGKVALITGASQGIGAALASQLQQAGCRLALVARSESALQQLNLHGALLLPTDLSQPGQRLRLIQKVVEHFGQLDLLVNNAGRGSYLPGHTTPMDQVENLFQLNVLAVLDLSQQAALVMRRGSKIVNVSSVLGLFSAPWSTVYAATKFAVAGLSDGLRIELEHRGIDLLTVYPGYVNSNFQANVVSGRPASHLAELRKFAISPQECADKICAAIQKDRQQLIVPGYYRWSVLASQLFPGLFANYLRRTYRRMLKEGISS